MKKPFRVFGFILLIFLQTFCSKQASEPQTPDYAQSSFIAKKIKPVTYLIPAGAHYCQPNPTTITTKSKLIFNAVFDSSCIYRVADSVLNYDDINKLYGFSDCNTNHFENSARVGWRWSKDSLRLFAFVHNDSTMLMKEMTTAKIGETISCSIECKGSNYIFYVKGIAAIMPRHCSKNNSKRYMLYPYFGGDEVAPHEIKIVITEL